MNAQNCVNRLLQVIFHWFLPTDNLNREERPRDRQNVTMVEKCGELFWIVRCRHGEELEILSKFQERLEDAEQHIGSDSKVMSSLQNNDQSLLRQRSNLWTSSRTQLLS